MPERQSSPGEVTARPETDANDDHGAGRSSTSGSRETPGDARQPPAPTTEDGPAVTEQVARQVGAQPQAVERGPADPGDEAPAPAVVGTDAATIAAPAVPPSDVPTRETTVASPAGDATVPTTADGGSGAAAATPAADVRPADAAASAVTAPVSTRLSAVPDPSPVAATPGDESPTVDAPVVASARTRSESVWSPTVPIAAAPAGSTAPRVTTPPATPLPGSAAASGSATPRPAAAPWFNAAGDVEATQAIRRSARPAPAAASAAGFDRRTEAIDGPTAHLSPVAPATSAVPLSDVPSPGPRPGTGPAGPVGASAPTTEVPLSDVPSPGPRPGAGAGPAGPVGASAATTAISLSDVPAPGGGGGGGYPGGPGGAGPDGPPPRRRRRRWLIVAGLVALLALLYVGDLLLSSGAVPRGVTVAGVSVGGLPVAEAEQRLRAEIEPRTTRPVAVTVGDATSEIDPAKAGLSVDWKGTLDQAGSQPLNPITRITSFFTEREVGVVTTADPALLGSALAEVAPVVDTVPTEGSVRFEGTEPVGVDPVPGRRLDQPAAAEVLERDWVRGTTVALPLTELPPVTTAEQVATAVDEVATPAVSAPVAVAGEGVTGTLEPEDIAAALSFRADPAEGLVPEINKELIIEALSPQLRSSERPGRDAALDFSTGAPVVTPSQDGRGVDYEATLADLLGVLADPAPRQITAVYADQPAEITTDEIDTLGISGVIGEFTTMGFAQDSGRNIKRAAEVINGLIVQPGETFSLNGATSPRDASNGYVEAGIIDNGAPGRGVGGGVSQVATTLYNAAYFAGMVDVAHQEHSFYISRYPPGREATVFEGSIDLKWRNDNPTGVLIQTVWTPNSLTVRLYGTKRYEVTSETGPRTKPTQPTTVTIPPGKPCIATGGAPGFSISDVRVLREISTGEVRREPRTVKYNPIPVVVCEGG